MKFLCLLSSLFLVSCEVQQSSDDIQNAKQEEMNRQAVNSVSLPAITNFAEKRMLKMILELRDKEVVTHTYVRDLNGRLHKVCTSIGFGMPYATQFTNPQKIESNSHGYATMPQADPNGLYSPASAEGTWVNCLNPETKKTSIVYVEDRITVSTFQLVE